MKFPNKMITETYSKASGRVFTHSPSFYKFTDEQGSSEYNYSAMLWLLENKFLVQEPWDGNCIVFKYKVKER
jgi:hypothetical protein